MFTLFANFKNYIMIGMLAVVVLLGGLYLWQRVTVVKQKASIEKLQGEKEALLAETEAQKKNVDRAKALTKNYQKLENEKESLRAKISKMEQNTKCIGEYDEKIFTDITLYFNSFGVRSADGS